MSNPIITLTTDFGLGSPYVAQMKGVLLGLQHNVTIVDITHAVPPQDIAFGASVLMEVCHRFPASTIHIAVVDPGVGTDRAILCFRNDIGTFVGPDNGVLSLVARSSKPPQIVQLTNSNYWRTPVSATFHGRDIMAPVAAALTTGVAIESLGDPTADMCPLDWPQVDRGHRRLAGEVVMIDSFGNLLTNIVRRDLPQGSDLMQLQVACRDREFRGVFTTYGEADVGAAIALLGSSDALELAVVNGNAAEQFDVRRGDRVIVTW